MTHPEPAPSAPPVVRLHDIPESLRRLCPYRAGYADLFEALVPGARAASPEEWARAVMEGAPAGGRFLAWRVACQLRLREGVAGHIAGWRVVGRGDDWIRVEARSWFMTASIVFTVDDQRVLFGTFIRYDRAVARLIWTPASAGHRAVAPDFLRGGVRRIQRTRALAGTGAR